MVYDPNFHELESFVALEKGPRRTSGDAGTDAWQPARLLVRDGGPHRRTGGRLTLAELQDSDPGDLRVGKTGERLLELPATGRRGAFPVRRPRSLGQAALPHPRRASRSLPAGRGIHRDPPRARFRGNVPERSPSPTRAPAAPATAASSDYSGLHPRSRGPLAPLAGSTVALPDGSGPSDVLFNSDGTTSWAYASTPR